MNTDVIAVGAGPTGLTERRTEPQRDSRALSLHPRSVELLTAWAGTPSSRS
ncbi:hypothetical protein ABZ719_37475 [Streptomyces sp. NPDC006743]|uniref:hypothetical protein n=1 Tax=Streptomyces sp. NPDC006743 TaxID=3154480 RepID=UPI003451C7A1